MQKPSNPIPSAITTSPGQSWLTSQVNQPMPITGSHRTGNWNTVRRGVRLMVGSLTAMTLGCLAFLLYTLLPKRHFGGEGPGFDLDGLELLLALAAGLVVGIVVYLVGLLMSLAAPAQARLSRLTWWCRTGLVAGGLILLLGILMCSNRGTRIGEIRLASCGLAMTGVVFLAAGCAGYSFYLAGIARRFGDRRLALAFRAFIPAVLLLFAWPAYALEFGILQPILSQAPAVHFSEKQLALLTLADVVLAAALGVWWEGMLWVLLKRLSPSAPAHLVA
jgi:hypothetical protein